jgi:hypothetical protein
MNLALPALIIFALLLPGIIYRYTYARGPWSWANPTSLRTISDELAYSVILAVGLHSVWVSLSRALGYYVDFAALIAFLSGNFGKDSSLLLPSIAAFAAHQASVATYFLSIYAGSATLGILSHAVVRLTGLDLRTRSLRFENQWYYLLTGEVLGFANGIPFDQLPSGVYVSAIIDQGKESILYWGIVEDFSFDAEGELDRLILSLAHRRPLHSDRESTDPTRTMPIDSRIPNRPDEDERYYEIRGDYLVIRYADVRTINLEYFWVEEESATVDRSIRGRAAQFFSAIWSRLGDRERAPSN